MPAKLERCVEKVSEKGTADNPWAVCKASTGLSETPAAQSPTPIGKPFKKVPQVMETCVAKMDDTDDADADVVSMDEMEELKDDVDSLSAPEKAGDLTEHLYPQHDPAVYSHDRSGSRIAASVAVANGFWNASVLDRIDLDWQKWNDEHKGGGRAAAKAAKAEVREKLGKATAAFEKTKDPEEGDANAQFVAAREIGNKLGEIYHKGGDMRNAVGAVIGYPGAAAIMKAVTNKAAHVYNGDKRVLGQRQKAAEQVVGQALKNGDAKKLAASMLIAHTYRSLAGKG